jgi:hypothetical protein
MQSFYGGKSGASFVIVKSFPSVAEMVANFQQGPDYSTVHYNEYVLINTENKNDKDNGKLYRRGYDYTNNLGGAIYIGSIVGPAGKAPMLELTTIADVKEKSTGEGDERSGEGSYTPTVNLVPGKNIDGTFNDAIEWAYCSVRDKNGEDTIAYIGFKFPYLIEEFTAASVSPYYNRDSEEAGFKNTDLIQRTDDGTHPYYESWHFSVPQGIKGDAFKNFRVMIADDSIESYIGQEDDITNKREVLVYDYYHYDKNESGEPTTLYLGDYNMIKDIKVDEDGTLTIDYLHDDSLVYSNLFKWVDSITLNEKGHLTVKYNYKGTEENPTLYETDLDWVNNLILADNGTITLYWSTEKTKDLDVKLKWITNVETKADGTITVNYNNGQSDVFKNAIQSVSSVTLDGNGLFTVKYNNGAADYQTTLTWVKDITIDADGTITIKYNNGDPIIYKNYIKYIKSVKLNNDQKFEVTYNYGEPEVIDDIIKFISNIYIDDDDNTSNTTGKHDYQFHVVYNTKDDIAIGASLNYIVDIAIDMTEKKDYHCLVYYSNGNIRETFGTRTYNGKDGWVDLGSLKDDAGVLVGFNIEATAANGLSNITTAIAYLNEQYDQGLTDAKNYGKIVTIGSKDQNKYFYAFDYNKNSWYYLGTFNNDSIWTIVGSQDDADIEIQKSKLSIGGVWFIVESK